MERQPQPGSKPQPKQIVSPFTGFGMTPNPFSALPSWNFQQPSTIGVLDPDMEAALDTLFGPQKTFTSLKQEILGPHPIHSTPEPQIDIHPPFKVKTDGWVHSSLLEWVGL